MKTRKVFIEAHYQITYSGYYELPEDVENSEEIEDCVAEFLDSSDVSEILEEDSVELDNYTYEEESEGD